MPRKSHRLAVAQSMLHHINSEDVAKTAVDAIRSHKEVIGVEWNAQTQRLEIQYAGPAEIVSRPLPKGN